METATPLDPPPPATTATPLRPAASSSSSAPPPETPITDFAALESQKENIQPLSTGRSAAALSSLFAAKPKVVERELREARQAFERELASVEERRQRELAGEDFGEDGEADPLDVYERYIKHVRETAPSGSTQSSLLIPLLERATKALLADETFAQDIRYVRLWIAYSRLVERKGDVFQFLLDRGIGVEWGVLYEEYAVVLEGMARRSQADEIYRLAIARRAKPLERLKQRYKAFQVRMMTSSSLPMLPPAAVPAPSASVGSSARTALGGLGGSGALPSGVRPANGKKNSLAIFVEGGAAAADDDAGGAFNGDLQTRDVARKENEREAVGWKGETLPQGRALAPRTPKLEVFRDDGDAAPTPSAKHSVDDVFARSSAQPEWELLIKDPLLHMRALPPAPAHTISAALAPLPAAAPPASAALSSSGIRAAPASTSGFIASIPKWEMPDPTPALSKNGKPERRRWAWDDVYFGGREWSFEEVRARREGWLDGVNRWSAMDTNPPCKKAEPTPALSTRTPSPTLNIFSEASPPAPPPAQPAQTPSSAKSKLSIFSDEPTPAPAPRAPSPPAAAAPAPAPPVAQPEPPAPAGPAAQEPPTPAAPQPAKKAARPSPTINTKAALSDVMGFFNAGAGDDEDDDDDDSDSSDDDEDELEPIMMVYEDGSAVPPTPTPASARGQVFALKQQPQGGAPSLLAASAIQEDEDVFAGDRSTTAASPPPPPPAAPAAPQSDEAAAPMIFRDENAGRPTPSKTPSRTPLSSRKPTFGVLADTREEAEPLPQQPAFEPAQQPAGPGQNQSVFSTPMPAKQPFRRPAPLASFAEGGEEDEEEGGDALDLAEAERLRLEELQEDAEDEASYRSQRGAWEGRVGAFELMTPITERTGEWTTHGRSSMGARSSIAPTDFGIAEEEEDEDTTDADQAFHTATTNMHGASLSPSAAAASTASRDQTLPSLFDGHTGQSAPDSSFDRSSSAPFALSEGYTIDGNTGRTEGMLLDTMQIVDKTGSMRLEDDASGGATAAPAPAPSTAALPPAAGQIDVANPCNPMDDDIVRRILAALDPPLSSVPGYVDLSSTPVNRLDGFQKAAKARQRRGSTGSNKSSKSGKMSLDAASAFGAIDLGGREFDVREKIGEGGFGAVFLARDVASFDAAQRDDDEDDEDDDEGEAKHLVALKVERPASVWEGVVLSRIHRRLAPDLTRSIISARGLYTFQDESYLVLDYSSQGTVLDAVNHAARIGIAPSAQGATGMDELVVMFFAVELLKVVEGLHRAGFVHGDLKIDNCLVRLESVDNAAWAGQYDAGGANGWSSKGVRVIDFGRAIDMSLYPDGQTFVADWPVDQRDCAEMREARPWSYQADYHGLASVFYCMLFGKYIETAVAPPEEGSNAKRYKIATPLKRYWQTDLWTRLFDLLLNPKLATPTGALPVCDALAAVRREMAGQLEDKCTKGGKNLKQLLKKLEREYGGV